MVYRQPGYRRANRERNPNGILFGKIGTSGSATLPADINEGFEASISGHLCEGYSLSEAPTATHCNPVVGINKTGSIGLPLPDVDCKIVDIETGNIEVEQGLAGELLVRSPQVMIRDHNLPDETHQTLREGWLHTADIARMDDEGYFYLVGRKKELIKVSGFQVWPREVEEILATHPHFKVPSQVEFRDEFPRTPVSKVLRRELVREHIGKI